MSRNTLAAALEALQQRRSAALAEVEEFAIAAGHAMYLARLATYGAVRDWMERTPAAEIDSTFRGLLALGTAQADELAALMGCIRGGITLCQLCEANSAREALEFYCGPDAALPLKGIGE